MVFVTSPTKDSYTRREYAAMIDVALGGRAAEEMVYGRDDVTSGCSSDLQRATDVAARMIRVGQPGRLSSNVRITALVIKLVSWRTGTRNRFTCLARRKTK